MTSHRRKTTSFHEQNKRISSSKRSDKQVPVAVVTIADRQTVPFAIDHSVSFAAAAESCQGGMMMTQHVMD